MEVRTAAPTGRCAGPPVALFREAETVRSGILHHPLSRATRTITLMWVRSNRVPPQNLEYSWLELKPTGTTKITDHRANPPQRFSITTMPLHYTYSCSVLQNVNSCKFREVFQYGLDTDVNPVDRVKHSYGWIGWRYYINSTGGNPNASCGLGVVEYNPSPTS